MTKKVVYVAGRFRAPTHWGIVQNVRAAEAVALDVWRLGAAALCPHMNTANFQGAAPDEVWLEGTLEMLRRCDAIITVPGWETSVGTKIEVDEAKRLSLPVFNSIPDLRAWLNLFAKLSGAVEDGTTIVSASALAEVRAKLGPNALIGRNDQFPEAPFHVGVHEHGEWKWFGAGTTWEAALKNVKKVKFQKAD